VRDKRDYHDHEISRDLVSKRSVTPHREWLIVRKTLDVRVYAASTVALANSEPL